MLSFPRSTRTPFAKNVADRSLLVGLCRQRARDYLGKASSSLSLYSVSLIHEMPVSCPSKTQRSQTASSTAFDFDSQAALVAIFGSRKRAGA